MNQPTIRFLCEIPFPLIFSQLLIIFGGVELGLTFQTNLVSMGASLGALKMLAPSMLILGLALNVLLLFRAHALLTRVERKSDQAIP